MRRKQKLPDVLDWLVVNGKIYPTLNLRGIIDAIER
jgi:hypothetical protein